MTSEVIRGLTDSTAQHFLYFGLGFASSAVVFLAFGLGILLAKRKEKGLVEEEK